MAAPSGHLPVGRYLASLAGIVAVLYALVFFTGDSPTPRLGLDLQGGTTVTLQARTEDGQPPSREALDQARQIIERRVNGLGVAEAEVVTQGGDRVVISVPGTSSDEAKTVGQTAQLRFRPVIASGTAAPAPAGTPTPSVTPAPSATPSGTARPSGTPGASANPAPSGSASPQGWAPAPTNPAGTPPAPAPTAPAPGEAGIPATPPLGGDPKQYQAAVAAYEKLACSAQPETGGASLDKTTDYIASCDQDGAAKYLLAPAIIEGTQIGGASVVAPDTTNTAWRVSLDFKGQGQAIWAEYTSKNNVTVTPGAPTNRVAFVLDGRTISAPEIQGTINGQTEVTGQFTQETATDLSNVLKYGALPLTFQQQEALTVSATLGEEQLQAGLLAGVLGLVLVAIYAILYYRILGVVTIVSLGVTGSVVYALMVILGRQIGFTLSLAGIAGFIIGIGMAADSSVVFLERLKDEVYARRSLRSAVTRAWVRARRTIISAKVVTFLGAAVLYYLAAGPVKGFALTLGISVLVDTLVVFLFTLPLVSLVTRVKAFTGRRVSGLGAVQEAAEEASTPAGRRASSARAGGRGTVGVTKES